MQQPLFYEFDNTVSEGEYMKFYGLQKMTLLDFPGKVACTVFTGGCNFRCPFCHNAPLVVSVNDAEAFDENEILSFLDSRKGLLDGICITGGEPLLYPQLPQFMKKVKEAGFLVKLDTNGSFPERLRECIEKGVTDYVAMDIKNSKEKYALTVGIDSYDLSSVEESVKILLSDVVDYEFRTTIVDEYHETQDIVSLCEWIKGAKRYFLQNFFDSGNTILPGLHSKDPKILQEMRLKATEYVDLCEIRGV